MNDGRKTRRRGGAKNEMAKINRQWQQISAVRGPMLCALHSTPLLGDEYFMNDHKFWQGNSHINLDESPTSFILYVHQNTKCFSMLSKCHFLLARFCTQFVHVQYLYIIPSHDLHVTSSHDLHVTSSHDLHVMSSHDLHIMSLLYEQSRYLQIRPAQVVEMDHRECVCSCVHACGHSSMFNIFYFLCLLSSAKKAKE